MAKIKIQTKPKNLIRFLKFQILHIDDSPYKIAMGVTIGLFVAWTPALGFHILIALGFAMLLRANKFIAIGCTMACNPFTFIFIYYPNYVVGKIVLNYFQINQDSSTIHEAFAKFNQLISVANIFAVDFWRNLFILLWQESYELWVGCLIVGLTIAIAGYFVTYYQVIGHRKKHLAQASS